MVNQSAKRECDRQDAMSWEDDLEVLFPSMNIVHKIRVTGHSEWQMLGELSDSMANTAGRLLHFSVLRTGASGIELTLKISGMKTYHVRRIARSLSRKDFVKFAVIEHLILK